METAGDFGLVTLLGWLSRLTSAPLFASPTPPLVFLALLGLATTLSLRSRSSNALVSFGQGINLSIDNFIVQPLLLSQDATQHGTPKIRITPIRVPIDLTSVMSEIFCKILGISFDFIKE
jgi:hypothetical protein